MALGIKHFLCKISDKAETCIGSCAQFLNWGSWDLDGTGEDIARTSYTNHLGIFPAIKMVVPLESGRNAILVLNRKMQYWVRECCVRPCVRMSVACCIHAWGLLRTINMFIFQASSVPSIWWYSLYSQIRSICLSTDFNKWLATEQNEWSERRGIGIL